MFELRFLYYFSSTSDLAFVPIPNTFPETVLRGRQRKGLRERSPQGDSNGAKVPQCLGIREDKCHQADRTRGRKIFFLLPIPRDGIKEETRSSKAPPRNHGVLPSGRTTWRTDGTWDPPSPPERSSDLSLIRGLQRSSDLPSLSFPRKGPE